mgnify:CR=1 FL=1
MSREVVVFLAGSPDRLALLDHLTEEPAAPRDVAEALDVSSRGAQRNLSELEDRGWTQKRDGDYHLTTTGHLVRETYADCLDRLDALGDLATLYEHLPDREDAPDPAWLADGTYVTAEEDHPQAPVTHYVEAVRGLETDHVRMLAPVLSRLFHEPHARQVQRGATTEVVLPVERVTAAREKNPLEFETVLAVPSFTLYRTDRPVEMGLTVTDDRTFLLAYDADGTLRACIESTDPTLREWAVERFDRYREEASEVDGIGPF